MDEYIPPRLKTLMEAMPEGESSAFNHPPAGGRETDLAGLRQFPAWIEWGLSAAATEYRQMGPPYFKLTRSVHLMWAHDETGFAFVNTDKTIRIFLFGCVHEMEQHSNDGRCLNTYRCSKCGYMRQVDSSD